MTTHQSISGTFDVVVNISPDPPPPPGDVLFALPNDNQLFAGGTNANYVWVFPDDCVLTRAALHGDSQTIGSFNTFGPGGVSIDLDFDLFIDGRFIQTLFTLKAGATDVDLFVNPNTPLPAGAEIKIAVVAPGNSGGALLNFLFSFSIGPT